VSWTPSTGCAPIAVKYQTTDEVHGIALGSTTISVAINSGTTPDEAGVKFQVPAAMTCTGARIPAYTAGWGSAAAVDVVLYNSGGTAIATGSISDKDFVDDTQYVNVFWDGVSLSAATDYRLIAKPTVSTNGNITLHKYTLESAGARTMFPEGANFQWTQRTDAGAWDDSQTAAIAPMGLWVSDITFSAGASAYEYGYIG
jgi:hypothetical protein